MEEKVLVVDDESSIVNSIAYALRREGYEVKAAFDGEEAVEAIKSFRPAVLILDVMMPKLNGFEVLKRLWDKDRMGIILLTAKSDIVDKVLGLELGADDYVSKPFDMRELLARVKSLTRRLERAIPDNEIESIEVAALRVIPAQRKALLKGAELELTPKEFDLLYLLLSHPERVFSREELLELVWDMDYAGETRTVDIHIRRLRKKLGLAYQDILQTVYGVGYKAVGGSFEG